MVFSIPSTSTDKTLCAVEDNSDVKTSNLKRTANRASKNARGKRNKRRRLFLQSKKETKVPVDQCLELKYLQYIDETIDTRHMVDYEWTIYNKLIHNFQPKNMLIKQYTGSYCLWKDTFEMNFHYSQAALDHSLLRNRDLYFNPVEMTIQWMKKCENPRSYRFHPVFEKYLKYIQIDDARTDEYIPSSPSYNPTDDDLPAQVSRVIGITTYDSGYYIDSYNRMREFDSLVLYRVPVNVSSTFDYGVYLLMTYGQEPTKLFSNGFHPRMTRWFERVGRKIKYYNLVVTVDWRCYSARVDVYLNQNRDGGYEISHWFRIWRYAL